MAHPILGIDIGGSGIKGALVDIDEGSLVSDRHRVTTPQPSKPDRIAEVVASIVRHFDYSGPVGCTFPAIVRKGVTHSAANVHKRWIGTDAAALFGEATGAEVQVVNDADAAGIAEMAFGAGRGRDGTVMVLTFGTGIGSALFHDGRLVPNTEFGHLEFRGGDAEHYASDRARRDEGLGWKAWAKRVDAYLGHLEFLFSPDLFIIGGGVSKKSDKFFGRLDLATPVVAAELLNEAGIVGAAYLAAASETSLDRSEPPKRGSGRGRRKAKAAPVAPTEA